MFVTNKQGKKAGSTTGAEAGLEKNLAKFYRWADIPQTAKAIALATDGRYSTINDRTNNRIRSSI